MNFFNAILLGALQGLTEFLPVSSSGHLVIAQSIIPGFDQPGVLFDTILHAGTLSAILIYFRKEILKLKTRYYLYIVVATVPAVLIGLIFNDFLTSLFSNITLVGFTLLITGIFNIFVDLIKGKDGKISYKSSLFVGLFQALAIIPGISRSGSTIFAARIMGLKKKESAKFSFLLSIPAVMGATMLELIKNGGSTGIDIPVYFSGFISAFVFGLIAIYLAIKLLLGNKFVYFGVYAIILGLFVIFA